MGITGLMGMIMDHYPPETWKTYTFRKGSRVILDGKNICSGPRKLRYNWVHGGQYGELRAYFNHFFKCLRENGIEPIVVFDGVDYTEEKSDTKLRRQNERIRNIRNGLLEDDRSEGVRPLFLIIVFCEIVKENGVKLICVDGDADRDIALLANHYNCPVVADDSDYFIFPLKAGYIPINELRWYDSPVTAKIYKRERFAYKFYFDSDPKMIYLIPAIMGNDFIKRRYFPRLKGNIERTVKKDIEKGTKIASEDNKKFKETLELWYYISSFRTVEEFISQCWHCSRFEATTIAQNYQQAKEIYHVKDVKFSEKHLMLHTILESANKTLLPNFIIRQYRNGYFTASEMAVLVQNKSTIPVVIDNPNCSSSMKIGQSIRKCLYRIMEPYLEEATVLETIRVGQEFCCESVACADESLNLPSIDNMTSLSNDYRILVLCKAMDAPPEVLQDFSESKWKLVALSLHFWSKHANPDNHTIKALILCFIDSYFNNAECSDLEYTSYERDDMWLQLLHIFAQWQCVYYDAFRLNNVLMNPLEFMSPALLFNGKLVMHYACSQDYYACTRFDQLKGEVFDSAETRQLFKLLYSVCVPCNH